MTDITTFSIEELKKGLYDSKVDIKICERTLELGIVRYIGGSVQNRIDINKKIIERIDVELARRQLESERLTGGTMSKNNLDISQEETYKEKLIALLEGLECRHIDELIEEPTVMFRILGTTVVSFTKPKQ